MNTSTSVVESERSQGLALLSKSLILLSLGVASIGLLVEHIMIAVLAIVAAVLIPSVVRWKPVQEKFLSDRWYEAVILPHTYSSSGHPWRTNVTLGGVILLALNLYAPAEPTLLQRLLALLIILLAAVPSYLWLSGRDQGIPFMPFMAGIYTVYYALPIFVLKAYTTRFWYDDRSVFPDPLIEQTLMVALLGLGLLLLGYYGPHQIVLKHYVPKVNMEWKDYSNVKLLAVLFGIVGISIYYMSLVVRFPPAMGQAIDLLTDLSLLSMATLFALHLTGHLGPKAVGFLWIVLVPTRVSLGLATGLRSQALFAVLLLLLVYATLRHRLPWKPIVAMLFLFVLLGPMQREFRAQAWYGQAATRSPWGKATLYATNAWDVLAGQRVPDQDSLQLAMRRFNYLAVLATVVEATPASVPYWGGATYYPLLFKPIPRFLFPGNKPTEVSGQTFGHRYGFLYPGDRTTSYNMPQLVELYANFGLIGVLLGMFLIGMFYRILQLIFVHPGMGLGNLVAALFFFDRLLLIESALSLVLGRLFWEIVFVGLFHSMLIGTERLLSTQRMRYPQREL